MDKLNIAFIFLFFYFFEEPRCPNFGTENNVGQRPLAHTQPAPRGEARTPSPRRMEPTQVGVLRGEEEEELHLGAFICLFIYLSKN